MFKIEDILLRIPNAMSDDECDFLIEHHKQNEEEHILEHCPDANTGVDTYSSFKCVMLKQYSEPHNIVHSKTKQMVERWKDHLVKFNAVSSRSNPKNKMLNNLVFIVAIYRK